MGGIVALQTGKASAAEPRLQLLEKYRKVRALTVKLASPLSPEDQCVQAMPDTSPVKWHLGHTTWFFETVVLGEFLTEFKPYDDKFLYLFNSYYESLGPRQPRPQRGLITRPSVDEVDQYRQHIDTLIEAFILECDQQHWQQASKAIELGLNHEEQHQELLLTDVKYLLFQNPFGAVYLPSPPRPSISAAPLEWIQFPGGLKDFGHDGAGFAYDNETPRHKRYQEPFQLANRLVTCGEYLEFIQAGGYANAEYWLSDGWTAVQEKGWQAPLYWRSDVNGNWSVYTLHGFRALNVDEPVVHVTFFEAMAYATWVGARLPREHELEVALAQLPLEPLSDNTDFRSPAFYHPSAADGEAGQLLQGFGQAWQWSTSAYDAYPGFVPFEGAVAEYNGKFMVSQLVLRGGSCVTPQGHSRSTYRNFFPPGAQWQFTGIRLAKDV